MPIDFEAAAEIVAEEASRIERNAEAFNTKDYDDMKPMRDSFMKKAMAMRMILMERATLLTANGMQADQISGLSEDLRSAVRVAFKAGRTEWVRLNYPDMYGDLLEGQ